MLRNKTNIRLRQVMNRKSLSRGARERLAFLCVSEIEAGGYWFEKNALQQARTCHVMAIFKRQTFNGW